MLPLRDSIPTRRTPVVNWTLIAVNVLVFARQYTFPDDQSAETFIYQWAAVPVDFNPAVADFGTMFGRAPSLFTSMFLHGGVAHLLGNMWFLHIFGDNVEDRMGRIGYAFFYVTCGLAAALCQVFFSINSEVPILGASGAIGGVMGAYMFAFPQARVQTLVVLVFVRLMWLPAMLFLGFWFAIQAFSAFGSLAAGAGAGGVAFWAHVGGFVTGSAIVLVSKSLRPDRWNYDEADDRGGAGYGPAVNRRRW